MPAPVLAVLNFSTAIDSEYVEYDEDIEAPGLGVLRAHRGHDHALLLPPPREPSVSTTLLKVQPALGGGDGGGGGGAYGALVDDPSAPRRTSRASTCDEVLAHSACRICKRPPEDMQNFRDVLSPCRCRGWVHRDCLNDERERSSAEFSKCASCNFVYRWKYVPDSPCETFLFYTRVIVQSIVIFLAIQCVVLGFAALLRHAFPEGIELLSVFRYIYQVFQAEWSHILKRFTMTSAELENSGTDPDKIDYPSFASVRAHEGHTTPTFWYFYAVSCFSLSLLLGLVRFFRCSGEDSETCALFFGAMLYVICCCWCCGHSETSMFLRAAIFCTFISTSFLLFSVLATVSFAVFGFVVSVYLGKTTGNRGRPPRVSKSFAEPTSFSLIVSEVNRFRRHTNF